MVHYPEEVKGVSSYPPQNTKGAVDSGVSSNEIATRANNEGRNRPHPPTQCDCVTSITKWPGSEIRKCCSQHLAERRNEKVCKEDERAGLIKPSNGRRLERLGLDDARITSLDSGTAS